MTWSSSLVPTTFRSSTERACRSFVQALQECEPMPVASSLLPTADPVQLRRAFGCFPSGVAALCVDLDGTLSGMAVSSFTSVSLDPPLVSVCMAHTSTTWPELRRAPFIGVSILGADHTAACRQLSSRTGDRFAGLETERMADGAVFVSGASAWLECTVADEIRAGDHDIVVLRVRALAATPEDHPLVFHSSKFFRLAGTNEL
ncbi:MAG: flavin reductase family protein [Rhodococcus sp. (in: high G+C Gram-positive bacteria)]